MMLWSLIFGLLYTVPIPSPGNVLVIIADDLGAGSLDLYDLRADPVTYPFPSTPNIHAIKQNGVLFKFAYANPTCSPTRSTIQDGRYGFRTGIGSATAVYDLPISEVILPEVLCQYGYRTALIGKWHLTNVTQRHFTAPNDYGFDYFSGTPWNISNYCGWRKIQNGVEGISNNYAPTENVDDALAWINSDSSKWFMILAFNTPHSPFHNPPVVSANCVMDINGNELDLYQLMIERMDAEIGRLLSGIDLNNTTVIFVGDNGTPSQVTLPPFSPQKAKGTVYEGGIRVPLIIGYNKIIHPNRVYSGLVNLSDVFSTVIELSGISVPNDVVLDSKSLVPVIRDKKAWDVLSYSMYHRDYVFSEIFPNGRPNLGSYCIRNETFKYLRFDDGHEEFYNLILDPFEVDNLIEDDQVYNEVSQLRNKVNAMRVHSEFDDGTNGKELTDQSHR